MNDRSRDYLPAEPQRGVNHASAVVRILERRIRALEAAVATLQSESDRSRKGVVLHKGEMTNESAPNPRS